MRHENTEQTSGVGEQHRPVHRHQEELLKSSLLTVAANDGGARQKGGADDRRRGSERATGNRSHRFVVYAKRHGL